jgi:hypothetical protein
MKTVVTFFILALVSAVPTTSAEEDERIVMMKYAETGKSWTVKATRSLN